MMSIAIIGEPCSGKTTLVEYLQREYNFKILEHYENDKSDINNEIPEIEEYLYKKNQEAIEKDKLSKEIESKNNIQLKIEMSLKEKLKENNEKYIIIFPKFTWRDYEEIQNKNSFRLINIVCPTFKRFQNFKQKYTNIIANDFINLEESKYDADNDLERLKAKAFINIIND